MIFSTNTWYEWNVTFTWSVVQDQYNYFSNPDNGYILGEVIVISSIEEISEAIETHNIQKGDLLYWSEGSEDELEHSTMISKIEDGMIYFTANTMTRFDQRLDSKLGTDTVYIIRIKDYIEQEEN